MVGSLGSMWCGTSPSGHVHHEYVRADRGCRRITFVRTVGHNAVGELRTTRQKLDGRERSQLRDFFVLELDQPERVWDDAGRLRDDRRVPRIHFRLASVQVRDAPHRKPRKVANEDTLRLRDRDRKHPDRGRLVNDQHDPAVRFQLLDRLSQSALIVRQRPYRTG